MKVCIAKDGTIRVLITDRGQNFDKLPVAIREIMATESVTKLLSETKVRTFWIDENVVFGKLAGHSQPGWEYELSFFGFLLPKKSREEWIGEFREALEELRVSASPRWKRCGIAIGWVCLLVIAALKIRFSDLISGGRK